MRYEFFTPAKIVFGWDRFSEAGALAASLGRRAFIVSGSRSLERAGTVQRLEELLRKANVEPVRLGTLTREPRIEDVDRMTAALPAIAAAGSGATDLVIGIGGGSAVDLAKAVAARATNRQSSTVMDYLEGVGKGLKIENDPLPVLAIPTTAGTGSEATKNAVISSDNPPFKKSLRSDKMVPRAVLVDPRLTVSNPPSVTAASGMDALTQLIESYISGRAQPIPSAIAIQTIPLAARSLERAFRDPECRTAREEMAQAALISGMALANSGLGFAHGVAAALGITCNVAHGLACAAMLPAALRVNREARRREIAEIGRVLTGNSSLSEDDASRAAAGAAADLGARIGIPQRLRELGVRREQLPELVKGSRGNSMSANPVEVSDDQLGRILEDLL